MDVTKSRYPNSIVLASAKIEISKKDILLDRTTKTWDLQDLEDLGLARGIKISFSSSKIDIKADNGTVPIKGQTDVKGKVEFALLERHIPLLGTIMHGLVTVSTQGGKEQEKSEKLQANTFALDKFYEFSHASFDNSKPKDITIKQGGKNLTQSDYEISQSKSGAWGYKFLPTGTCDITKPITIEYKTIPIKSYRLTKGSGGVVQPISMRLTNSRKADDGRIINRTFEFPYGFYDGEDSIQLKSKNDSDNVAEVPMSFEFSPHPDLIGDEELEPGSLYREDQDV
ncbi:hypothetical protein [Treponema phagedenis]|uniref:hypothetical protein n=1 Tax=Treponema phagedenis TaxID=162 RepID=UPI0015A11813|nr:hypothetical protein [Treponema phagedenis]NVP24931.1 hypothetical protein [Treponema phagedenis]NVP25572.1 hypothetical protein [Treponema phagedenis]NVP25589.1 hypothetical protein [Treponema phagedenis]QLC59103.1 hypothetical protein HW453_10060 [Treponema phagedenis]QLC60063.1 hypothetical protein HW453_15670 [Treponema phagedenis]